MRRMRQPASFLFVLGAILCATGLSLGQSFAPADEQPLLLVPPRDRILSPVDDLARVPLKGNTSRYADALHDAGAVESSRRLDHVLLLLKLDATQQHALDALLQSQLDPASPLYRQWLTPQSYARYFGLSSDDRAQVKQWLESYGLVVEGAASGRTIAFSGTAAQVAAAFQTRFRRYELGGKLHLANATDPTVPSALAEVIDGVVSLNDFFSQPQHAKLRVAPEFTSGTSHYLAPGDFAAIYSLNPLYREAIDGEGQTIVIAGRADISLSDVRGFRSQFGLRAHDPVVIVNGRDPGGAVGGDVDESTLDVEWSGAVANQATIDFVTSASTAVTDGVFLSLEYAVDHNVAPILSVSYGLCEALLGAGGNGFLNALWQQAAAQGITVVVSSGDSGAAGCDAADESKAISGSGVNGMCSTPFSTCVGGTAFEDGADPARYWASSDSNTGSSALGYIPEAAWNESAGSGLWSSGGGLSSVYTKPSWQSAPGVPSDGQRDVPDVALSAATHDGYLVELQGGLYAFGGTSASAPSFAGMLALIAQQTGGRLGNVNPELYKLAAQKPAPEQPIFNDVTEGNNSVPGLTGYSATPGYDPVTGLGSVNFQALAAAWAGRAITFGNPIHVRGGPTRRLNPGSR